MGASEQGDRDTQGGGAGGLDEIRAIIDRVRDGGLSEQAALSAIGHIVRQRTTETEIYQKPWG